MNQVMQEVVLIEVFKDTSFVMFRRIDNEFKECLNAFLYHELTSFANNDKNTCLCSTCAN